MYDYREWFAEGMSNNLQGLKAVSEYKHNLYVALDLYLYVGLGAWCFVLGFLACSPENLTELYEYCG